MKKVIVLAVCLFSLAASVNAQEGPKPVKGDKAAHEKMTAEQRAEKQVEGLSSEITLTPEQKPKVYDLMLAKVKKADEIRTKYKDQPQSEERAKELAANRKQMHQNLKSVLTPEQFEKLKAKHKEMKAAGKQNSLEKD